MDLTSPKKIKKDENGVTIKKACLDLSDKKATDENSELISINQQDLINLKKIKFEKVLSVRTDSKAIFVLGSLEQDKVVISFEKLAFDESNAMTILDSDDIELNRDFANDIYGNYFIKLINSDLNRIKCTIIHPATEKHILKYSFTPTRVLLERPEDYQKITLPYIENSQLSLEWVINILEHKQETERIVLEDLHPETGFILLPDLKWDTLNELTLYLVAIVHARDIRSLRDLQPKHLPLLRNIKNKCLQTIKDKWSLDESKIRVYLHYQPSYYHLHVHFTHIQYNAAIATSSRSHMLDTVISNLEINSDYYQKITLPFEVREGSPLHKLFTEQTSN